MSPPLNLHVHAMRYKTRGIVSVKLYDVDGKALPGYAPGAHIELHLSNGLVCSYSLCGAPEVHDRYVIDMLLGRSNHGGSRYVHEQLHVGSALKIDGPRNHFEIDETVPCTMLVTSGISVTSVVCMARRLAGQGKAFSMPYYARSRADAAFADELAGHGGAIRFHLDAEIGGPLSLKALLAGHSIDTHFYYCGPGPVLRAFEAACGAPGYTNVHIERSATDPGVESVQDGEYQAKLTRNGAGLCVPAGKSLPDALLEIGVEVEHNCKEGVCGSCEMRVLEGEPDHRDNVLSKSKHASSQTMMACMSGCKGKRLVINLQTQDGLDVGLTSHALFSYAVFPF